MLHFFPCSSPFAAAGLVDVTSRRHALHGSAPRNRDTNAKGNPGTRDRDTNAKGKPGTRDRDTNTRGNPETRYRDTSAKGKPGTRYRVRIRVYACCEACSGSSKRGLPACVYAYTRAARRVRGAPKGGLPAFVFAYTREDHEYREHDHRSQERDLGRAQAGTML